MLGLGDEDEYGDTVLMRVPNQEFAKEARLLPLNNSIFTSHQM